VVSPLFATSSDGTRVAYDVSGRGQAVMLLHGGGHSRADWHKKGYVETLSHEFRVVAVDIRGNGESDQPTEKEAYATDRMCEDLLAVADRAEVDRFAIWGYSLGGNVGRYLAARSDRVDRIAILGIPFGLGATGRFREAIEGLISRWSAAVEAFDREAIVPPDLALEDIDYLTSSVAKLDLARFGAILDWEVIKPADLLCPAMWLIGSENESAMDSARKYKSMLGDSQVQLRVLDGLDHQQEFDAVSTVLPVMLEFLRARAQEH
jgi:pimeloyl-ACP methyl ester carboxylesterase